MSIEEYIKGNDKFSRMPFSTVYAVLDDLISDGYVDASNFELAGGSGGAVQKVEPPKKGCRGLHCKGDCHCHEKCVV